MGEQKLHIESRVSDKDSGEIGSPIQFDPVNSNWYIHAATDNQIYTTMNTLGVGNLGNNTPVSFIKRIADERSLDEKVYKLKSCCTKRTCKW